MEVEFYDQKYDGGGQGRGRLEQWLISMAPALPEANHFKRLLGALGNIDGLRVFEIGCGPGDFTFQLASRGARVLASDISAKAVDRARERNRDFIPHQVEIERIDLSQVSAAERSFDLVTGIDILHHLDLQTSAMNISKVLKPGGRAVFIEPLAHNPISNIWRRLTPSIRTSNERPLSYAEIEEFGRPFSACSYSEFQLVTLLSSLAFLLTQSQQAKKRSAKLLAAIEPQVLAWVPMLRRFSGMVMIELTK